MTTARPNQASNQASNNTHGSAESRHKASTPTALAAALKSRRQKLAKLIDFPVLLWSGTPKARNFAANVYPFRASSHFLYFAGLPLENAAIRLEAGKLTLFMDDCTLDDALWHGPRPSRDFLAQQMGADEAQPIEALADFAAGVATLGERDQTVQMMNRFLLQRGIVIQRQRPLGDRDLEKAIVKLRMIQDEAAIAAIRQAILVTVGAHRAGMGATRTAKTEAQVRAIMEAVIIGHDMDCAYGSIVTIAGEILHNHHYHNSIVPQDLLLADVGAETPGGWAADITRTWPVSGKFTAAQHDIYDIVLAAHDFCIEKAVAGIEYRDIHLMACEIMAAGLVDLGILKGHPEDLVEQDAHALFFPHGVGHLMGLDVHDMEDLGDLSGYKEGRDRSDRFGLKFLRLDRPLEVGMAVTIEPGFYQVPAILNNAQNRERYATTVNWEKLEQFKDVRGIRIEDDVLITPFGNEVLSEALPTKPAEIEQLVRQR
ncbi:MAG: aminopeptidase P family protein [Cyanobacteria bacterium J06554_3]